MDTNSYNLTTLDTGTYSDVDESINLWAEPASTVNDEAAAARATTGRVTQLPTTAAADIPAAIGWGLVGIYAAIMLDFVLFFTASRMAALMVGVSFTYFVVYLAVPAAFFRIESVATGRNRRVSLNNFLKNGLQTWTGHVAGWEAIAQIFTIPVVLAVALFAIGLAWQAVR